jgi:hypothetical protein
VLAELIVVIAGSLIRTPFAIGAGGVGSTFGFTQSHASALSLAISAVGGILASTLTAPLLAGIVVLLYTDLLMRREGMDIKLQAAAASGAPGYASPSGYASPLGSGSGAGATWAGPASPGGQPGQPGWNVPASGAGTGTPAQPGQPGWNVPGSGTGTGAPGQTGQPGWNTPAGGTGTGAPGQTGQPGWNTPPASPTLPGSPGGPGWEDTVGWPERPRPAGGSRPEDGGTGTGTPDPNAW